MPRSNAILDNFNRASIGANWSSVPLHDTALSLTIAGSTQIGLAGYQYSWWNVGQFDDQANSGIEAAIAIPTLPGNTYGFWVSFLQQPGDVSATCDGYEFGVTVNSGNDSGYIGEYLNSVLTTAVTVSPDNWAAGDILIARRSKTGVNQLIRDRGGVETVMATVTDTTYTGNFFVGLGMYDAAGTARLDDFSAGNFTVAPAGTTYDRSGTSIVGP